MPVPKEEMVKGEWSLAAEPKARVPFAYLPKGTFVLDELKLRYSNKGTAIVHSTVVRMAGP